MSYILHLTVDLVVVAFLTPANAMLSVELTNLANMLDSVGQLRNVSQQARTWSSRISDAIYATAVRPFTPPLFDPKT